MLGTDVCFLNEIFGLVGVSTTIGNDFESSFEDLEIALGPKFCFDFFFEPRTIFAPLTVLFPKLASEPKNVEGLIVDFLAIIVFLVGPITNLER